MLFDGPPDEHHVIVKLQGQVLLRLQYLYFLTIWDLVYTNFSTNNFFSSSLFALYQVLPKPCNLRIVDKGPKVQPRILSDR